VPPLGSPNEDLGTALKQLSAAKHGRPRALVEKDIFKRMETVQPKSPSPRPGSPPRSSGGPSAGGSSFLDEWLAKREKAGKQPEAKAQTQKSPFKPQASSTSVPSATKPAGPTPENSPTPTGTEKPVERKQKVEPVVPVAAASKPVSKPSAPVVDVQNVGSTLSRKIRSEVPAEELQPQSPNADPGTVSLRDESSQLSEGEIFIDEQGNLSSKSE